MYPMYSMHILSGPTLTPSTAAAAAPRAQQHTPLQHQQPGHRATVRLASSSYSFADTGDRREVGERRNRTVEKRANAELSQLVKGLVAMRPKQLAAVAHLLSEEQLQEIGLAARLPRINQASAWAGGRKRHENRVAQLIRTETSDEAVHKLAEAVQLAQASASLFVDADVAAAVDGWVEGLKAGDGAVLQEVGALLAADLDMQQLRRLAQQLEKEAADGVAVSDVSSGGGDVSAAEGGLEVAQQVLADPELLALLTKRGGGKGAGARGGRRPGAQRPMGAAERKIRALLRPAAMRREREAAVE